MDGNRRVFVGDDFLNTALESIHWDINGSGQVIACEFLGSPDINHDRLGG